MAGRHVEFVTDHQHGHGEIQREIGGVRGDSEELGAEGDFGVEKALIFAAKDQRDPTCFRGVQQAGGQFARSRRMLAVEPLPSRGANNQTAIGHGLGQGGEIPPGLENRLGGDGALTGFRPIQSGRRHEGEVGKAEIGHRTADHSHVPPVEGLNEDDAEMVQTGQGTILFWLPQRGGDGNVRATQKQPGRRYG